MGRKEYHHQPPHQAVALEERVLILVVLVVLVLLVQHPLKDMALAVAVALEDLMVLAVLEVMGLVQ